MRRPVHQVQILNDPGLLCDGQELPECINHDISDEMNTLAGPAFSQKIFNGVFFGHKQIIGQRIGQHTIDFFGHGTVEAAQTRLDVDDLDADFDGRERSCDRGINVSDNEEEVRPSLKQYDLDSLKYFRGLPSMGARTHFKVDVRFRNGHLPEEDIGKLLVIVLACVNQCRLDLRVFAHFAKQWSYFD
jgi:hypothetical protein